MGLVLVVVVLRAVVMAGNLWGECHFVNGFKRVTCPILRPGLASRLP
jgi:hypothetical protein